jgi:branched-subunit amino acid ABC-type transport system permease component
MTTFYLQLLTNGVIAGSLYALFAVGLTLVYGVFRFINFAHGELIAWGAYLALLFSAPPFSLPLAAAMVPAVVITVGIGLLQDRLVYNPLRASGSISLLIASIGLSFFLRSTLQLFFGSDLRSYGVGLVRGVNFNGIIVTWVQLAILVTACVFLGFLYWLLKHTLLGKALRAVSDNRDLALIMGLPMTRIHTVVWTMASAFAAAGGILLALDTNLEPLMGLGNLIKAFAAVLLGGAGNVWGALAGGMFIGLAENLSVPFLSPGYKDFIAFAVVIVMLLFRPRGLFAHAEGVR